MKKAILGIFVMTLLIATAIPVVNSMNNTGFIMGNWSEQAKLIASDGAANNYFGRPISIDGDYVILGAWGDDDYGSYTGSAYIFKRTGATWPQEAKLLASDGTADDRFGYSASISGDYAVVGAYHDDNSNGMDAGSAYIFHRTGTTWTEEAKLLASDGNADDYFGCSVSIDGDYVIVGAYCDDDLGDKSGSAYIFKRTGATWSQEAKLLASDGTGNEHFGIFVSISGDYTIIGASWDDDLGYRSGSAYIFHRTGTTWAEEAKLLASDGESMDTFGFSVAISGVYAVVGSCWDDDFGDKSGSAYIFKRSASSWTQEAKLIPSDSESNDEFGISVSISGDYTIVGSQYDDDNGASSGSAYVFRFTGTIWTEEAKLLASDGAANDYFGSSVSIAENLAIIGAIGDDDNGDYSGSAYVFNKFNQPPNAPSITGPTSGSAGTPYPYTFISTDPDEDQVSYYILWGDGTTPWTAFQASGSPGYSESHTWSAQGTYTIQAKAKDTDGAESGWTTLQVTMPRNRAMNTPFLNFLQNHPNLFPILRYILGLQ